MKLSWDNIDIPWVESDEYVGAILSKSDMLTVLDACELEYFSTSSGNFSYKMKCPFSWHAERTPSFFISSDKNNFYCFGCNFSGNSIDFVQHYLEKPYDCALDWLAKLFGISKDNAALIDIKKKPKRNKEETIDFYTMKCSKIIRDWLTLMRCSDDYNKYSKWADKQFEQIDELMNLEDDSWMKAKEKFDYLEDKLKKYFV